MKKSLCTLMLYLVGFFTCECVGQDIFPNKRSTLRLELDDYINHEAQWVYLYGIKTWISGNEKCFYDSAYIRKDQKEVLLKVDIPIPCSMEILFEKNGPNIRTSIEPDSCVVFKVTESDGDGFIWKEAVQGQMNNYEYKFRKEREIYWKKLRLWRAENKSDSIALLQEEWKKRVKEAIKTTTNGSFLIGLGYIWKYDLPDNSGKATLMNEVANKEVLQQNASFLAAIGKVKALPASTQSRRDSRRIMEISKIKRESIKLLDTGLGAYFNYSFNGADGKKLPMDSLNTDYVLVDFWASWCKPCRKEIPYIKQALNQSGGELSVYAVSIDKDHQAWQQAIRQDSTQAFHHVIATYPNGQPNKRLKQLNIKSIPANWLVDKERRIIAKDLRGDELLQTLDSLMKR